jgi:hypothetical protein
MSNKKKDREQLRRLLSQIPTSGSYESAALSRQVSELLSTMTDEIFASSEGTAGPYIVVSSKYAVDLFGWLNSNRVPCTIPEDAVFLDDQPTDAVINIDRSPKQIEPLLDKWFVLLHVVYEKTVDGAPENPVRISWQYAADAYRDAIIRYRREHPFLRPG